MHAHPASITTTALASMFRPARRVAAWPYDVGLVLAGSAIIALSAQVAITLPLHVSPVPVTGQTMAVLLVAALFGMRLGVATVVAYLLEGAVGLPVFAQAGAGVHHLIGPTGGYLWGFVVAAVIVGALTDRGWDTRPVTTVLAMTLGTCAVFVPGVLWLAVFVGPQHAVTAGLVPFLPGAAIKIALAATMLPLGWRVLTRRRR